MSAISASRLRPLIGSRSFYREAVLVMLPVAGQQLLNSMFGFFDNLMVGMVDAATLSGVTVANKVFFVYQGIFWGITGAGGLLLSQYYGAGDRKTCQILFALQQLAGLLVAIAFTGILLVAPEMLLRAFVSDPATIAAGMGYVELIRFSYLPAAVSMVSLFSLRSVGQSKVPFVAGLFTISVNIVLNWIFIFGKLDCRLWADEARHWPH
jgi:Na+-driven multidrug efflux pump